MAAPDLGRAPLSFAVARIDPATGAVVAIRGVGDIWPEFTIVGSGFGWINEERFTASDGSRT